MSMDRCDECERPIDTDFDVECYVPHSDGSYEKGRVLCHVCRARSGSTESD
jgi:hypothetical protein